MAIQHLRTGDRSWDMRSYVAIHLSVILGLGVLVTGSIWARASWGHWWVWDEPVLVSFLVVFLLYCVYYPLRFSIEDPERQGRYASVFAIAAGAFVPLNFIAVRLAQSYTHPRVLSQTGGDLPGEMRLTFLACLLAMTLLWITLWKLELIAKHASMQVKRLKRKLSEREAVAA
jgi:heme exporter protein C